MILKVVFYAFEKLYGLVDYLDQSPSCNDFTPSCSEEQNDKLTPLFHERNKVVKRSALIKLVSTESDRVPYLKKSKSYAVFGDISPEAQTVTYCLDNTAQKSSLFPGSFLNCSKCNKSLSLSPAIHMATDYPFCDSCKPTLVVF